jgi:hypothetical protein
LPPELIKPVIEVGLHTVTTNIMFHNNYLQHWQKILLIACCTSRIVPLCETIQLEVAVSTMYCHARVVMQSNQNRMQTLNFHIFILLNFSVIVHRRKHSCSGHIIQTKRVHKSGIFKDETETIAERVSMGYH